ncbi:hypothetical protein [Flavobacterium sp. H122]|uniref:hypothetical protein n=1 Tax=Flavobacterium sp. H122 TaxID=2529860 RepID=UPI0010AB2877|nr:hypothetical protein [Flavobacterium sp. H122]
MLKNILNLEGIQELNSNEQKSITAGLIELCKRVNGNTGQTCSTDAECTGPNSPVCFNGCCNTWV